jgi:hypothetical protein
MDFEFVVSDEGLVDVLLADDLPILSDALSDSLGTRAPRGAPQDGPSTYWIDNALAHLHARLEDSQEDPFASGNATYLALKQGVVEARYDYDEVDSGHVDAVPPQEFLDLLEAWRAKVMEVDPEAANRIPPARPARPMPPSSR